MKVNSCDPSTGRDKAGIMILKPAYATYNMLSKKKKSDERLDSKTLLHHRCVLCVYWITEYFSR